MVGNQPTIKLPSFSSNENNRKYSKHQILKLFVKIKHTFVIYLFPKFLNFFKSQVKPVFNNIVLTFSRNKLHYLSLKFIFLEIGDYHHWFPKRKFRFRIHLLSFSSFYRSFSFCNENLIFQTCKNRQVCFLKGISKKNSHKFTNSFSFYSHFWQNYMITEICSSYLIILWRL